jgi:hypothetical protein
MEISAVKLRLSALKSAIIQLNQLLNDCTVGFVAKNEGAFSLGSEAVRLARDAYSSIWYEDGVEDGRFTSVWLGGLAVSPEAISKAKEINLLKDQLQASVIAAKKRLRNDHQLSSAGSAKSFRRLMNDIGLSRLSLRMAYRHIPILDKTPKKIAFSYSSGGRSISKLSPQMAIDLLEHSGFSGDHIEIQTNILKSLPASTELAQVQQLAGYFKTNVRFEEEPFTHTMAVFLPILFPQGSSFPEHKENLPAPQLQHRLVRSDRRLCSIALIPSLRIHAYRN